MGWTMPTPSSSRPTERSAIRRDWRRPDPLCPLAAAADGGCRRVCRILRRNFECPLGEKMKSRSLLALAALLGMAALPAMGAQPGGPGAAAPNPAMQGRTFFRAQCLLCHSAEPGDNGGAQGPGLAGLMGRKAATGSGFGYTAALKNSDITWDAATLAHFLAAPTQAVPGTSMVIPVADENDRKNLVAYFTALNDGSLNTGAARQGGPPRGGGGGFGPPRAAPALPAGEAEWKKDAPGVVHRVDLDKLPAPYATPSA